jgi:ribosomal-protein-alanine N-acetyltransferase
LIAFIQTDLVLLRPLRREDQSEFVRVNEISRDHWTPWMPTLPPGQSFDEVFEQGLVLAELRARGGTQVRFVAVLPDGRIAGFFALSQIFRGAFQNAYAGWRVSSDELGRGIATSGVIALLDLAFSPEPEGLGLHRVQANIIPSNRASIRVAEKVGFRLEGEAKDYLEIDGRWQDHLMFAKLAEEHEGRLVSST